jgi:hypothetical protein
MSTDPRAWLRSLPAKLAGQKAVMEALIHRIERDDRVRLFIVGCSIGGGAARGTNSSESYFGRSRLSTIPADAGLRAAPPMT